MGYSFALKEHLEIYLYPKPTLKSFFIILFFNIFLINLVLNVKMD